MRIVWNNNNNRKRYYWWWVWWVGIIVGWIAMRIIFHAVRPIEGMMNQNPPSTWNPLDHAAFCHRFSTDILPTLPSKVAAIGIDTGTVYTYNVPDNVHEFCPTFVNYWLDHIHPQIQGTTYYFLLAYADGYREHIPHYSGELEEWRPPNDYFRDAQDISKHVVPLLHTKKTVLAFAKRHNDIHTICVPDPRYIAAHGYKDTLFQEINDHDIDWSDKLAKCVWRGSKDYGSDKNFMDYADKDGKNQRQYFMMKYQEGRYPEINADENPLTIAERPLSHTLLLRTRHSCHRHPNILLLLLLLLLRHLTHLTLPNEIQYVCFHFVRKFGKSTIDGSMMISKPDTQKFCTSPVLGQSMSHWQNVFASKSVSSCQ